MLASLLAILMLRVNVSLVWTQNLPVQVRKWLKLSNRAGAPVSWMEVLSFPFLKMKGMFVCWISQTCHLVCDPLIVVGWSVRSLCLNMTDTLWVVLVVIVEIMAAATQQLKHNHLFVWLQWKIALPLSVCCDCFVFKSLELSGSFFYVDLIFPLQQLLWVGVHVCVHFLINLLPTESDYYNGDKWGDVPPD